METDLPRRGWFATRGLRLVLAVTFLTRLPLPVRGEITPEDMRASMGWYPLVGLGLGAVGYAVYLAGGTIFPATVAAALTIIVLEMCTGALHLDGVMDTCDGIGSGAPRERALEIMKDSRVGAMGVFGATAMLLLKVTALAALSTAPSIRPCFLPFRCNEVLVVLLIGWAVARTIPLWAVTLFPYARAEGTGKAFTAGGSPWMLGVATACALLIAFLSAGIAGLLLAAGVIGATLLVLTYLARRLGGLTGDVYGMGIELAELLTLLGWYVVEYLQR